MGRRRGISDSIILLAKELAKAGDRIYFYVPLNAMKDFSGALTLALGGILGILNNKDNKKRFFIACALIGIGMGMFADGIGLLLNSTNRTGMSEYFFPESGDIIT